MSVAVPDAFLDEFGADPAACSSCGRDSCDGGCRPDVDTRAPSVVPPLRAQRAIDVIGTPRPVEIVEGIAWAGCITVVIAESGAGKTFVLLDLAAAISDGVSWHGRDVRKGSVAYLSYEGDALGLRLRALREHAGRGLQHVYVIRTTEPLSPRVVRDGEMHSVGELRVRDALDALTRDIAAANAPPLAVVVIDTVRASMAGSEDSSEHTAAYLRAVRRVMATVPTAAGILVHHAGWQDGEGPRKRERGSSAWRGNVDGTIYLEAGDYDSDRGEAPLTLRALKVRDAERPAPLHLFRRRVEFAERAGDDIRRGPVTSCVIDQDRRSREDREAAQTAAVAAETRDVDTRVLKVISDRPESSTSQDRLRVALGLRRELVQGSLARLLERGWILSPDRQRQPYRVSPTGLAELSGAAAL